MLLPEGFSRRSVVWLLAAALPLISACTVRPLYSNTADAVQPGVTADLSSISIKPVETRYAQELRNHLIFAFNGGAGQPAAARYTLTLFVTAVNESGAVVQIANENEPTAGTVIMTARYQITDTASGDKVADGRRQISSAYDVPRQEFAAIRAQRDAENRAARELAELLKLAIAQDFVKRS